MINGQKIIKYIILSVIFLTMMVSSCGNPTANQTGKHTEPAMFTSFRDVPDITEYEIKAIENLQKNVEHLVYGLTPSTEAFLTEDGEIGGFVALFCDWLTALFGIRFQPEIMEWGDIFAKLKTGEVDFSNFIPTEERLKTYFMTDPIAIHSLKIMRIEDSPPLDKIALTRPVRYVFLENSAAIEMAVGELQDGTYKIIPARDYDSVYQLIKNGDADAFIEYNMEGAAFDAYGDAVIEDFFPLVFSKICMAAVNRELAPVISVITKALRNGGIRYVNKLYNEGHHNYMRNKFMKSLTAEEKAYLQNTSVVPVTAAPWFYPLDYYNKFEKKWEGIAFDVLDEVTNLTGLSFEVVNSGDASWAEVFQIFNDGAPICLDLIASPERINRYLWSKYIYLSENYALVSKYNFPNISISEIQYAKIGLIKSTAWANMFQDWFPEAANTTMYASQDDAFQALDRNEVDLVMAGTNALFALTHYYEFSNYKANYVFNSTIDYVIAYNKGEHVLLSVIDKALVYVDIKTISKRWESKTFDYKSKLMQTRFHWLIVAICLSLGALIFILIFYQKNRLIKKQLEIIFNNVESGIIIIDVETREIIDINPVVTRMYGRAKDKIINQRCETIFCTDKGCPILDYNRSIDHSERQFKTASGEIIPVIKSVSKINYNGRPALLENFSDISYLKKAEEAKSASEAKSRFIANMSHEMRTPLNAITGMTAIGKNAKDMERKDYALDKIKDASTHLLGVINDVLDMSKIEANMLELSPVEFNFEKMLQNTAAVINFRVDEKNQKLTIHIDSKIPKTLIADDQRLSQVITNLLSNAVKFTHEKGSIILEAHCIGEEKDVYTIQISVTDNGIGISDEQQKRLFMSFQQAESSTTRKYGGTGLGLAISKSIVELMDGKIWITSEPEKGSTFSFTIMAKRGKTVEIVNEYTAGDSRQAEQTQTDINGLFAGRRVLLAEDVEINREVVLALLEPTQLEIDCAENGAEAVRMFSEAPNRYELIFMDVQMPEMDGYEATRRIRSLDIQNGKIVPIVAMTANAFREDIEECLAAGMDDHIGKPIDFEMVIEKLRTYLLK
jgi:PAS domain S-box-containing protein